MANSRQKGNVTETLYGGSYDQFSDRWSFDLKPDQRSNQNIVTSAQGSVKNRRDKKGNLYTMAAWTCFGSDLLAVVVLLSSIYYYEKSQAVRYYLRFTFYFVSIMIFAVFLIPIAMWRPGNVHNTKLVSYPLGPFLKKILGLHYVLLGAEKLVHDQGVILVANHQSALDFLAMVHMWPIMDKCAAISKKEIMYAGPFGLVAWLCGTVFINRGLSAEAKSTVNRAGDTVRQKKVKLWMFPEGTRNEKEEMLPFKKGAFHLAIASQLPIQPVVISRYYFLNSKEKLFDQGNVIITVLPPISTEGLSLENLEALKEQTYAAMSATLKESSLLAPAVVDNTHASSFCS